MRRVDQLNEAVDALKKQHDRWTKDTNAGDSPPNYLCDAIDRCHHIFNAGPCPPSHIPLNNAVMGLKAGLDGWNDLEPEWTGQEQKPSAKFWTRFRSVIDERDRVRVSNPGVAKSVSAARASGMTDEQIANYLYGFRTSDGETYDENGDRYAGPLLLNGYINHDAFEKELRQPGSVIPAGWINPRVAKQMKAAGMLDEMPAVVVDPPEPSPQERREQAVKLLKTGGNLPQIEGVTKLKAHEIEQIADEEGIPLPSSGDAPKGTPSEVDNAILEELAAGTQPHKVVNKLRSSYPQINLGMVNNLKNQLESTPSGK